MTKARSLWVALLAAVLVVPAGVAAADSSGRGAADRPMPQRGYDPALGVWVTASAAPGGYLEGATLTVTDRRGRSLSGRTNPRGLMRLRLPVPMRSQLPLRVSTSGGTVNGVPFGGHLASYLWPGDLGAVYVPADLATTAAAGLVTDRGQSASSETQWTQAVAKVREVLGIPDVQRADVLRTRNPFVGAPQLAAAVAAAGGFDRFVAKVVRAAAAPHRSVIGGLAPPAGTYWVDGGGRTGGTGLAATATTGDGATDAVCATPNPAVWGGPSFSTGAKAIFASAVAAAASMGGAKAAAATAYYVGKLLYKLGNAGYSPDASQLGAISDQLDCIEAELANLTGITTTLTSITKFAPATQCAELLDTQWASYQRTVNAAIPATVPVVGNAGSSLYIDSTAAGGLQTGDVVTGTGIGQLQGSATAASMTAGSYAVDLAAGTTYAVTPGMQVTGTGIGSTTDGPAVVRSVTTLASGETELVLTAPNTASYTGSGKAPTLTFTDDNYIVDGGIVPGVTNPSTGQPATLVTLAGTTSGTVAQISYAYPLTLGNTTTNPTNTASPALSTLVGDWFGATQSCGTAIDDTLFGPTTGTGGPTGYQAFLDSILVTAQTSTLTPTQVQQIQAMLQYWGLYEVKQLALEQEDANWNDNPDQWNAATGYAPATTVDTAGVDGYPVCASDSTGALAYPSSACVGFSHLANAWPDDLFSDEVGQLDTGIAVNGFPGGLVVAGTNPATGEANCTGTSCGPVSWWNVTGGTDTALNPSNWLSLYWQLGGNPACQPDSARQAARALVGSPGGSCKQGAELNSNNWSQIQNSYKVSIAVNGSNVLSSRGPQSTDRINASGLTPSGPAAGCPVGRPFVTAAACHFNVQGFNPANTSVTVVVENPPDDAPASTSPCPSGAPPTAACYAVPGLVETWASPKAAHTILPVSSQLGDRTNQTVVTTLLDGMRCSGAGTSTGDGANGTCVQPASSTLVELPVGQAGFFAADSSVEVGLWWNSNLNAVDQNDVVYLYPFSAGYGYHSTASGKPSVSFPSSEPSASSLYSTPLNPGIGSCYAQGADGTYPFAMAGPYPTSPLFKAFAAGTGNTEVFVCGSPTYLPGRPNPVQPVGANVTSQTWADAFLLGRAWWAGASAWAGYSSPPAPLTAPPSPGSPTDLSAEAPADPAPAAGAGTVTAGWSRPLTTSTGAIGGGNVIGYVAQATLSDGSTAYCDVAGPSLAAAFPGADGGDPSPGSAGSGAGATFATCTPPVGSGLTVAQIQVWAVNSFGNLSSTPATWTGS